MTEALIRKELDKYKALDRDFWYERLENTVAIGTPDTLCMYKERLFLVELKYVAKIDIKNDVMFKMIISTGQLPKLCDVYRRGQAAYILLGIGFPAKQYVMIDPIALLSYILHNPKCEKVQGKKRHITIRPSDLTTMILRHRYCKDVGEAIQLVYFNE